MGTRGAGEGAGRTAAGPGRALPLPGRAGHDAASAPPPRRPGKPRAAPARKGDVGGRSRRLGARWAPPAVTAQVQGTRGGPPWLRSPGSRVPAGLIPDPACSGRVRPRPRPRPRRGCALDSPAAVSDATSPPGPGRSEPTGREQRGGSRQMTLRSSRGANLSVNQQVWLRRGFPKRGNSGGARAGLPGAASNFSASAMMDSQLLRGSETLPYPATRPRLEWKRRPRLRSTRSARPCAARGQAGAPTSGPARGSFSHLPESSELPDQVQVGLILSPPPPAPRSPFKCVALHTVTDHFLSLAKTHFSIFNKRWNSWCQLQNKTKQNKTTSIRTSRCFKN